MGKRETPKQALANRPEQAGPASERQLPPLVARTLARFPRLQRYPHPFIIHFTIVYMLSATFFSLLYLATGDRSFDDTAFYCLGAGVLSLPPAIATGIFTHWLNFPGSLHQTAHLEKRLSYTLLAVAAAAFVWRMLDREVLQNLAGVNLVYLFLVLAVTPLVTATSYFGGMVTFPLESAPIPRHLTNLPNGKGKRL
jgi:uncharacterized membrane protein